MIIKNKTYDKHTYIMGILNVTPDSFSDGGKYNNMDAALFRAEQIVKEGGDIIDIGGCSTRPGYTEISAEEETERTAPVIAAITARFDVPVSIDTYKASVAEAAFKAGAAMVNDIWGFKNDPLAAITAQYGASCCLMHNRTMPVYNNFLPDILSDLELSIEKALAAGVPRNKICVDPGVGFGKTQEQNLLIINRLGDLKLLGFPLLLGASRKSVIGNALGLPVDQRLEGTIATSVLATIKGCRFVRVHDVEQNRRAIVMTEKILGNTD